MNAFKKLNDKPIFNKSNFPILNYKEKNTNSESLNYLDVMNKKISKPEVTEKENNTKSTNSTNKGLCTIYYDKELKKMVYENFPNKTYSDSDSDTDSDSDSDSETESDSIDLESSTIKNTKNQKIKNMQLHNGMNRAIKMIMENRDKFIDQYGADEFIRDYLPKDSVYLYSRYYYKNKYMNYCKKKWNNKQTFLTINNNANTNAMDIPETEICPINELDIIHYEELQIDDDIDEDDIDVDLHEDDIDE